MRQSFRTLRGCDGTHDSPGIRAASGGNPREARRSRVEPAGDRRRAGRPRDRTQTASLCCRTSAARSISSTRAAEPTSSGAKASRRIACRRSPSRRAHERLKLFNDRVGEIEARRRAQLDEINQQQEHAQFLEDDVFEALEEEERLKHEWIVEREIDSLRELSALPSWTDDGEDDRRFRKSLVSALLASLALAIIVPFIELPLPEEEEPVDVPERVITMMMQDIPRPKPVQAPVPPPPQIAQQKPIEKAGAEKGGRTDTSGTEAGRGAWAGARDSGVSREARCVQGCADRRAARVDRRTSTTRTRYRGPSARC